MNGDTQRGEPADDLEQRLGDVGRQPLDPEVRAAHLWRAGAVTTTPRRRFGPLAVGAASVVGFLAGSAGLAAAGALPDTAQNVAHDVFGVVQVDVPEGKNRRGVCMSEAAKIEDKDAKRAAKESCPKGGDDPDDGVDETDDGAPDNSGDAPGRSGDAPGKSGEAPGRSGDAPGKSGEAPGRVKHGDDPCRGTPPWAGPMPKAERDALKEQHRRDACPDDDGDTNDAPDDDADLDETKD